MTIGGTAISLGGTATTISGLTSLVSNTLSSFTEGQTNSITLGSGNITFEGSTADANETILTAADATGGDKTLTLYQMKQELYYQLHLQLLTVI